MSAVQTWHPTPAGLIPSAQVVPPTQYQYPLPRAGPCVLLGAQRTPTYPEHPWIVVAIDGFAPSLHEVDSPIPPPPFPDVICDGPQYFHSWWMRVPPHSAATNPCPCTRPGYPTSIPKNIPRPDVFALVPFRVPTKEYTVRHVLVMSQEGTAGICLAEWGREASQVESGMAANELDGIVDPIIVYSWPGYPFAADSPHSRLKGTFTSTQIVSVMAQSLNHWVAAVSAGRPNFQMCYSGRWRVGHGGYGLQDIYLTAVIELELEDGRVVWMPAFHVREM